MNDKTYNRILQDAERFGDMIAQDSPDRDKIVEIYRNGAIMEHNHFVKWHDPKQELPDEDVEVLCMIHRKYQTYTIARFDGETWWQPVIPITAIEYGGWIGINEEIIAWREIHEK
jgi:hypothetical protein